MKPGRRSGRLARIVAVALLPGASIATTAARGEDVEAFFRAHQVTVYVGYGAGGGYDLYCRLLARHLGAHLPGNPAVVVRNEPGAGSFKLANELYETLPRDGSAIGMVGEVLVNSQILGDPAARFVARDFNWIGRLSDSDPVMITRADSGVATIDDAAKKEIVVGVPGAGSATGLVLSVVNSLLGTRFKLVSGYDGSAQIKLALERGEVQGASSTLWSVDKDWIRASHYNVLYQIAPVAAPDLPGAPTIAQIGRDEEQRRLLAFFTSYTTIGRSILAPPGVPADRVAALRAAFDAALADPALIAEAGAARLALAPMDGEALDRLVREATSLDARLLARARELRSSGTVAR